MRLVNGDIDNSSDPVMLILPPGMTEEVAIDFMNNSIEKAGLSTNNGIDDDYFEALRVQLSGFNIAIESGLKELRSEPWDRDSGEDEPEKDDPDWVNVRFASSPYDSDALDMVGTLEDDTEVEFTDLKLRAFCTSLEWFYPRGDKYGVPESATDSGGRKYVSETFGINCSNDFEVESTDTGDDSSDSFVVNMRVHKDCIREIDIANNTEKNPG